MQAVWPWSRRLSGTCDESLSQPLIHHTEIYQGRLVSRSGIIKKKQHNTVAYSVVIDYINCEYIYILLILIMFDVFLLLLATIFPFFASNLAVVWRVE